MKTKVVKIKQNKDMSDTVKIETGKLAKEKGYWGCYGLFRISDGLKWNTFFLSETEFENNYPAPTQSELQKWLREQKKIEVTPLPAVKDGELVWDCQITRLDRTINGRFYPEWANSCLKKSTFEEALEAGLVESLKRIKD